MRSEASAISTHATSRPIMRELTTIAGTGGSLNRRDWSRIACHAPLLERWQATLTERKFDQSGDG